MMFRLSTGLDDDIIFHFIQFTIPVFLQLFPSSVMRYSLIQDTSLTRWFTPNKTRASLFPPFIGEVNWLLLSFIL
ncbi:MAG TPA: hypothetical protein DGL70_02360, partial [Exiguobacterium sp.]|nr:hypothetical protein [Exiguobacterium sp.]